LFIKLATFYASSMTEGNTGEGAVMFRSFSVLPPQPANALFHRHKNSPSAVRRAAQLGKRTKRIVVYVLWFMTAWKQRRGSARCSRLY